MKKILLLFSILCFGFSSSAYAETGEEYFEHSQFHHINGHEKEAIKFVNKAIKLEPENNFYKYYKNTIYADIALQQYNYPKAIKLYKKSLEYNPDAHYTYRALTLSYLFNNNFEEAVFEATNALKYINNNDLVKNDYETIVYLYKLRAMARWRIGDADGSINDCDIAISLANKHKIKTDFLYHTRGRANCIKKDYKNAILDFSKSISINPIDPETYYYRAVTYSLYFTNVNQKKYLDMSIKDFQKAKELYLEKNNIEGYNEALNGYKMAIDALEEYSELLK